MGIELVQQCVADNLYVWTNSQQIVLLVIRFWFGITVMIQIFRYPLQFWNWSDVDLFHFPKYDD